MHTYLLLYLIDRVLREQGSIQRLFAGIPGRDSWHRLFTVQSCCIGSSEFRLNLKQIFLFANMSSFHFLPQHVQGEKYISTS